MRDKFTEEVHRRLCDSATPELDVLEPIGTLLRITEAVAQEHPVWFLKFKLVNAFRRRPKWPRS